MTSMVRCLREAEDVAGHLVARAVHRGTHQGADARCVRARRHLYCLCRGIGGLVVVVLNGVGLGGLEANHVAARGQTGYRVFTVATSQGAGSGFARGRQGAYERVREWTDPGCIHPYCYAAAEAASVRPRPKPDRGGQRGDNCCCARQKRTCAASAPAHPDLAG